MTYRLTPRARGDLRSIFAYTVDRFGERQADAYRLLLKLALERIGNEPQTTGSRPRPELGQGVRSVALGLFARRRGSARHVLFYRPSPSGVIVLRVLHVSMDPGIAEGLEED
ncbi:type II toxin-antitoxin system RelE/ParE family toxin [Geminicoccaceae bacterium 1502E]|nr:type II toxin-antitoxin system RelE/ParE family toxin [Geminicoccaceae bacterium 1502E]